MWIMKAGQWEVALDLLGEMKATGVQANEVTYSILFDVLAAAGQWQRALHLFMTLDREGKGRASEGYQVRQSIGVLELGRNFSTASGSGITTTVGLRRFESPFCR